MEKILLFSDDEKLFEITKQVTEGKQELIWGNYQCLETNGSMPFSFSSLTALFLKLL